MNDQWIFHNVRSSILDQDDVDTDAIIPQTELVTTAKTGLSKGLFARWRYDGTGLLRSDFVLNKSDNRRSKVLVSGRNFGCGSSREHAVWALKDYGIVAVLALSFGEIFYRNSVRNGLIVAAISDGTYNMLLRSCNPESMGMFMSLDLGGKRIEWLTSEGLVETADINIDDGDRERIASGQDDIDITLKCQSEIDQYVEQDLSARPWIYSTTR